jgi:radical SAM protein with 4Fe4S-binding SPASM domain
MTPVRLRDALRGLDPQERFRRYRQLWAEAAAFRCLTDFPMHLDIELSGRCNLRCAHCFQNGMISGPLGFMDFGLFTRVIDEGAAAGLCAVKLQVRGESMLHPRFFEALAYAKSAGVMDIQLTTNATLLDEEAAERLLAGGLDGIIFSVDAHHGESFRDRYRAADDSPVEDRVARFLARRARAGATRPWVRLQTALPELNADTVSSVKADLARRFPAAELIVVNRMQDFREGVDVYPDLHDHYRLLPCSYPMHRLAVYWNGDVTACCVDYNNRFGLGRFPEQSVRSIWLGPRMSRIRELHRHGGRTSMAPCRHCHACTVPAGPTAYADDTDRHVAGHALEQTPAVPHATA